jgi:FtsP/CotA-like multicopper oxidase with cupredoxin domain
MGARSQPEAPSARHARLGETLRWEVHNNSMMAHPYHLHGFSFQALRR